jgi:hypothetical protein
MNPAFLCQRRQRIFIIAESILLAAFVIFSLVLACSQIKPSDTARAPVLLRRASVRNF